MTPDLSPLAQMIHLNTIGPVSIDVGATRLTAASPQACGAMLYFVGERGQDVPRQTLTDLLFPDSSEQAAAHGLRQLLYRLRQMGVHFDSNGNGVSLPRAAATESIESIESRGAFSDNELDALSAGALVAFPPQISPAFAEWIDQFRSTLSKRARAILLDQLRAEKARHRFDAVDRVARACLALDPLNEEATLAAAEVLVMRGSKTEAISLLDRYINEVGTHSADLRVAPRLLRERISDYVTEPGLLAQASMVGRDAEIGTLRAILARVRNGSAEACVVWGQSGIGKTRLLSEACSIAALEGLTVVRCALQPHDQQRPLAVLRDMAPRLLDLPGALGCSPDSLALMRGLCGRGKMPQRDLPRTTQESESALARIIDASADLLDAVCAEGPLLLCIEDAHWLDSTSLELIAELVAAERPLGVLIASQKRLLLTPALTKASRVSSIELSRLSAEASSGMVRSLFKASGGPVDDGFAAWAMGLADGVPFYLHSLFVQYLNTGDRTSIPPTLTASLTSTLDLLVEPARSVLDAIVVLGSRCTVSRLERLVQLPRHALLTALRELELRGLVKSTSSGLSCAHDLFALATRGKMPPSIAHTLHRATAEMLELESNASGLAAWDIAEHWARSGDAARALDMMAVCAQDAWRVGRPQDAMEILTRAVSLTSSPAERLPFIRRALEACQAAGEWHSVAEFATELIKAETLEGCTPSADLEVVALDAEYHAGMSVYAGRDRLMAYSADRTLDAQTRVRAVKCLLFTAEDFAEPELAATAIRSVEDLGADRTLGARMVYETVFGRLDVATAMARDIIREEAKAKDLTRRFSALYNAAMALWRCGEQAEAIKTFLVTYAAADEGRIVSGCVVTAAQLADCYWCTGDTDEARAWHQRAGAAVERVSFPDRASSYYAMGVVLALEDGDPDEAQRQLDHASRLYSNIESGRRLVERTGFDLRIRLARGLSPQPEFVDRLLTGYGKFKAHGLLDEATDSLIAALRHMGRSAEAAQIKSEYLSVYRRETYPPGPHLPQLCDA